MKKTPLLERQLQRMLADGPFGAAISVLCLGAAYAVKRGEAVPQIDNVLGAPLTEEQKKSYRALMARIMDSLRLATPEEVDAAIALYTEHLRRAGYTVEAGYAH